MKVALVYDRVNKWGGAERVLLALHELFPDAPLYTSVYNPETALWTSVFDVKTSFLQSFPLAKSSHELYPALMPLAFESFTFDDYELVISVTSEAAKGIITKPKTLHICYCLTPTRYLWSGYGEYFKNSLFRFFSKPVVSYLRSWEKLASRRPDAFIAISKEVKKRIHTYYNQDSVVVYPPVLLEEIKQVHVNSFKHKIPDDEYFLIVSRLVPYKRVDIAVRACSMLRLPLVVVGSGSDFSYLKTIAGPTVTFIESLTDEELVEYYKGCLALIFCGNEDFGLTIIEAQSFGRPVIAYRGGGALETVVEGQTGTFFYPGSVQSLISVLKSFKKTDYSEEACKKQAEFFGKEKFKKEFIKEIESFRKKLL